MRYVHQTVMSMIIMMSTCILIVRNAKMYIALMI